MAVVKGLGVTMPQCAVRTCQASGGSCRSRQEKVDFRVRGELTFEFLESVGTCPGSPVPVRRMMTFASASWEVDPR